MQGKTHRKGGTLCAIIGFLLLKWNGYLLDNVASILQLLVIYPFAMWGSVANDLDHHWESCPDKSVPNYLINKLLHITTPMFKKMESSLTNKQKKSSIEYNIVKTLSASHRSWQTHSDLTLAIIVYCLLSSLKGKFFIYKLDDVEIAISALVFTGITIGIIAHFILDMLTPSGVWLVSCILINKVTYKLFHFKVLPEKIRFVPKSKAFATGSAWEDFICELIKKATIVATVILIVEFVYPEANSWILYQIKYFIHWLTSFRLSIS